MKPLRSYTSAQLTVAAFLVVAAINLLIGDVAFNLLVFPMYGLWVAFWLFRAAPRENRQRLQTRHDAAAHVAYVNGLGIPGLRAWLTDTD